MSVLDTNHRAVASLARDRYNGYTIRKILRDRDVSVNSPKLSGLKRFQMTIKLGVVMDPIDSIAVKKDSTLAMLLEAQRRGWQSYEIHMSDLRAVSGKPYARMRQLQVADDPTNWFTRQDAIDAPLSDLDVILMRKDPPFDMEYIYGNLPPGTRRRRRREGLQQATKPPGCQRKTVHHVVLPMLPTHPDLAQRRRHQSFCRRTRKDRSQTTRRHGRPLHLLRQSR